MLARFNDAQILDNKVMNCYGVCQGDGRFEKKKKVGRCFK